MMTKEETIFMTNYDLKEMSYYCGNDKCFEAKFINNDGDTFEYKMSLTKVVEHIEKTCRHPEHYMMNKDLVVAHFHRMARAWYAMTHLTKKDMEAFRKDVKDFEETPKC